MAEPKRPQWWGQTKGDAITFYVMSDKNKYTLTRSEFAKSEDITVDLLKKRMKRGHYKDQFVFHDGKYLFSRDKRERPYIVNSPGSSVPTKRKRNRGNHFNGKYPNYKMQQHNELKMLAKLKHNVDDETQDLLPEAIKIAKAQKVKRIQKASEPLSMTKDYGKMLTPYNSTPMVNFRTEWKPLVATPKDEYQRYLEDNDLIQDNKKTYY